MKYACSLHLTVLKLRFAHAFACIEYVHIVCVPLFAGLLWLYVVITCPPPPHVPPEMHTSVNSTDPDKRHRVVGNDIRTFNSAQKSSDESVSLIEN